MSNLLKSYLTALSLLKSDMKQSGYNCGEIDLLEIRLRENVDRCRYGDTKENQAERNEILDVLNEITRDIHGISFYEYCQANTSCKVPVVKLVQQQIEDDTITIPATSHVQETILEASSNIVQQAIRAIVSGSEYVATLQKRVQNAKDVFSDRAVIDQDRCESALSPFILFDCSNFPDYNSSLYRAKTRLQNLNFQVNKLINLCEICDTIDRPSRSTRKDVEELIRILNLLSYDIVDVQTLLDKVDVEMPTQ